MDIIPGAGNQYIPCSIPLYIHMEMHSDRSVPRDHVMSRPPDIIVSMPQYHESPENYHEDYADESALSDAFTNLRI